MFFKEYVKSEFYEILTPSESFRETFQILVTCTESPCCRFPSVFDVLVNSKLLLTIETLFGFENALTFFFSIICWLILRLRKWIEIIFLGKLITALHRSRCCFAWRLLAFALFEVRRERERKSPLWTNLWNKSKILRKLCRLKNSVVYYLFWSKLRVH